MWGLAKEQDWPLTTFFSEKAIQVLSQPTPSPKGDLPLIEAVPDARGAIVGGILYGAVKADLGHDPTTVEIRDWMASPELAAWMDLATIEAKVADPFYRRYFADFDPFFDENIKPFEPGIPVIDVEWGDVVGGVGGTLDYGIQNINTPILETLRGWGWDIDRWYTGGPALSFSAGASLAAHQWALSKTLDALYPEGVPPELAP